MVLFVSRGRTPCFVLRLLPVLVFSVGFLAPPADAGDEAAPASAVESIAPLDNDAPADASARQEPQPAPDTENPGPQADPDGQKIAARQSRERLSFERDGLDFDSRKVRGFGPDDNARERWRGDDDQILALRTIDAAHGDSLALPVEFPGQASAWRGKRLPGLRFYQWSYTGLVNNRVLFDEPSTVTGRLEYSVWLPGDLPQGIRVQARLILKTKDGLWYEALGRRAVSAVSAAAAGGKNAGGRINETVWEPASALHPGWNRIRVDLDEASAELRPRGHQQRWSRYVLGQVREIGIAVQGDLPYRGTFAIDDFSTWNANDRFGEAFALVDLAAPPPDGLRAGDAAEWRFGLNRPLLVPFRQREVAVYLIIQPPEGVDYGPTGEKKHPPANAESPEGRAWRLAAYYDQPHERLRGADGPAIPYRHLDVELMPTVAQAEADRYVPVGPAVWRARWRPPAPGRYLWHIEARYTSPITGRVETLATPPAAIDVSPTAENAPLYQRRGFVRVSARDPRYFEFGGDGSFFFPVGHSFRSPADTRHVAAVLNRHYPNAPRPADRGLRVYEEIFPRLQAAGMNVSEVWMASWWLDLEWAPAWRGYHHLQGYNLENADKLDRLLELARRHGQYLHLTLDNHGKASSGSDAEWILSPYRAPPDGPRTDEDILYGAGGLYPAPPGLSADANGFFKSPLARELYRDKLRYVVARWGQDPAVFAWELWSELDLTGGRDRDRELYASDYMREWHAEMAGYIRSLDPTGRPVATHYSGNHNIVDWTMAAQPYISYLACDAYTDNPRDNLLAMLAQTARRAGELPYRKPFMITEYGGGALGAPSVETLYAHFFAGMWWGWLSSSASTPFNWWYEWIMLEDMYRYYAAFTGFIAGEDKRRGPGEPALVTDWPRRLEPRGGDQPGVMASLTLADGNVYYALVNNAESMTTLARRMADRPRHPGALLRLGAVGPGPHTVELWNVWTGEMEERREGVQADASGVLDVPVPAFTAMLAVKVRAQNPRSADAVAKTEKKVPPRP